jgi:hypothetical protein
MIHKIECESLSCDNCNADYESAEGFTIFIDDVHCRASDDDWFIGHDSHEQEEYRDKHYCPKCHTIDDDDNIVLKTTNL